MDVAVELVALVRAKVIGGHLVVLHRGVVVGADVFVGQLFGPVFVLVHKAEAAAERGRRLSAIHLLVDLVVDLEVLLDDVPGLLRNHQEADTELRHNRHRVRRHRCRVGAPPEGAERVRPDVTARLLYRLAPLDVALLERIEHELGVFEEALPALVLIDAEPLVLDPGEPAAEAQDHAAA